MSACLSIDLVFGLRASYHSIVRRLLFWLAISGLLAVLATVPAEAATTRMLKVLPHFLDTNGVHTLSPSLYERDAYQAHLRQHPELRTGIRFDVHWKATSPAFEPRKLRLELRGIAKGDVPRQTVLEQAVESTGWFGRWTTLVLSGEQYRDFGELTAWRATIWEGNELLGEQKSFLW